MLIDLWTWVNQNSGGITGLSTVILVAITAVYVVLTRRMVLDNQRAREVATRPEIVVSVVLNPYASGFLNMVIENAGINPAFEVRFSVPSGFSVGSKRTLDELGVFKNGISVFPPGQRIEFFLASTFDDFDKLMSTHLDVSVSWKDASGHSSSRDYPLRFDHFQGLSELGTPPESEMADALKKIENHISRLGKSHSELKVVAYSPDEIRKEHRTNTPGPPPTMMTD